MKIVLASSSRYRKELLARIIDDFECASPSIDESATAGETPQQLAQRLAEQKALALAKRYPNALIIGSDQVAWLQNHQLHKPGNREANIAQLQSCQGQRLDFYTGIALYNSASKTMQSSVERYQTQFRPLSDEQITRYVDHEQAYDCAGGFKMEGKGIALFERIEGEDPNILIGLPLIRLVELLEREGVQVI